MSKSSHENQHDKITTYRISSPEDDKKIAMLLAQCFSNSPVYNYIVPYSYSSDERLKKLEYILYSRLQVIRFMGGTVFGSYDQSGNCLATVSFGPVATTSPSFWVLLATGSLWAPFVLGFSDFQRILTVGEVMTQRCKMTGPSDYSVNMMVVHPDYQGKGMGTQLLKYALASLSLEQVSSDSFPFLT